MIVIDNWAPSSRPDAFLGSPQRIPFLASLSKIFGLVLLAVGIGGVVYAVLSYLDPAFNMISTMFTQWPRGIVVNLIGPIAGLVLILLGATLVSPIRHTLLFLRRFDSHANVVVSRALASPVTWPFRTVTLDDEHYPSRGVPLGPQLIVWISVASVVVLVETVYFRAAQAAFPGDPVEIDLQVYRITRNLWPCFVGMLTFVMAAQFTRVHRRARLSIRSRNRLPSLTYRMQSSRRWWRRSILMSGHSTIASVSSSCWRDAVSAAMREADIVVMDISEPSDSIAWELEQARTLNCKTLLIGDRSAVTRWALVDGVAAQENELSTEPSAATRLSVAIGAEPVLAYLSHSDHGDPRFRENLGYALNELAGNVGPSRSTGTASAWFDRMADVAFYGVLLLVVIGWPVMMVDMTLALMPMEYFDPPIGISGKIYDALLGPVRLPVLSFGLGHLWARILP